MKKVVLLFSGQGAQSVGMGRNLVESFPLARKRFEKANEVLGWDLIDVMFNGPEEDLTRTSRCQPALYVQGFAIQEVLRAECPALEISAAAGLSLGEFTAHAAAGTFSFEKGLEIVARRGVFMEEACEANPGAMAAMIGGDEDKVCELAQESGVDVANFNAPGQIVLSGSESGIDTAVANAKAKGIRIAKKLKVAGAYHSSLMASAQEKLAGELSGLELSTPQFPVIANFTATVPSDETQIRETLTKQVTGSVRWTESMQSLIAQGEDLFVECGSGKVLTGLMSRTDKTVTVLPVDDGDSLAAAIEVMGRSVGS